MKVLGPLAVLLALIPAGTAADGGPGILFSAGRGDAQIVFVRPDGTSLVTLTSNEGRPHGDVRSFSWAPNGARIAFVSGRDGPTTLEIYVMNADGSGQRRLTFDSGSERVINLYPAWSPDGTTIAFVQDRLNDQEIWLMNPDGTDKRRLIDVGAVVRQLSWSPDGTRLLYAVTNVLPNRIEVVDVRTGSRRSWISFGDPAWSPDGRSIAIGSSDGLAVYAVDNERQRSLSSAPASTPTWSPDGNTIAFGRPRSFPELADRYGAPSRSDVYVVRADGTAERRLTGPLGPEYDNRRYSGSPSWWPDGSRLFFLSDTAGPGTTYVMNADGSCEQRFGPADAPSLVTPAWQPATPNLPPPIRCVDLHVTGSVTREEVPLNASTPLELRVANDGNVGATGIRLEIESTDGARVSPPPNASCSGATPMVCTLPPLGPQSATTLGLLVASGIAGTVTTQFGVSAEQAEPDVSLNKLGLTHRVSPCTILGTDRDDNLRGTLGSDAICGGYGADRIDARGGNDVVDSGPQSDAVVGGSGRDSIASRGGRDVIRVRDRERDTVACGSGHDIVLADRIDRIDADCESVSRRGR